MKTNRFYANSAGFSLVEVLVALAVVTIITSAVVFSFNFQRSKGEALYVFGTEIQKSVDNFEIDTSCQPDYVGALWSESLASMPGSNSCGADLSPVWGGPYTKQLPSGDGGVTAQVDNFGPGANLSIHQLATGGVVMGAPFDMVMNIFPVSGEIANQAVRLCNRGGGSGSCAALLITPPDQYMFYMAW